MNVFYGILCFLSIFYVPAWGSAQKTVCSITINSDDEIKEFKKTLSPKLWNFIELTELDQEDGMKDHFLAAACKKKISCDILLISGHFGGSFFGKSGKTLSLDDLENLSCDKDCSGILQNPKEVFLFGCNTLATKEKDHRTPEEYRSVLLHDGFTLAQANEVVAYRYSEYGSSTQSRMMNIFNQTTRIYGFSSVAPLGTRVKSSLQNYLKESKRLYSDFDEMNRKLQASKNQMLIKELSSFSITQVTGANVSTEKKVEKPYCYLQNSFHHRYYSVHIKPLQLPHDHQPEVNVALKFRDVILIF